MKTVIPSNREVVLGRLGENEYTRVGFDVTEWINEYPSATFTIYNQLPMNCLAYPVDTANVELVDGMLYWTITDSDLSVEGGGFCQIACFADNVIAKSVIYQTKILPALDGAAVPPSPYKNLWDRLEAIENKLPAAPAVNGTYVLKCTVTGGVATYSWVAGT